MVGHGLTTAQNGLAGRLLLCEIAKLVEPLGGALAQHVGSFATSLGCQHCDFAAVTDALFEHLFGVFGVLRDAVFSRSWLRKIAKQSRDILDGLTGDLDLALGNRLHAFDSELVGLAQGLDIAALTRHQGLDVKRTEAEIGHHLRDVEVEKRGTRFGHEYGSGLGEVTIYCAPHNEPYIGP